MKTSQISHGPIQWQHWIRFLSKDSWWFLNGANTCGRFGLLSFVPETEIVLVFTEKKMFHDGIGPAVWLSVASPKWFLGSSGKIKQLCFLNFFVLFSAISKNFFHFCFFSISGCFIPFWVFTQNFFSPKFFYPAKNRLGHLLPPCIYWFNTKLWVKWRCHTMLSILDFSSGPPEPKKDFLSQNRTIFQTFDQEILGRILWGCHLHDVTGVDEILQSVELHGYVRVHDRERLGHGHPRMQLGAWKISKWLTVLWDGIQKASL